MLNPFKRDPTSLFSIRGWRCTLARLCRTTLWFIRRGRDCSRWACSMAVTWQCALWLTATSWAESRDLEATNRATTASTWTWAGTRLLVLKTFWTCLMRLLTSSTTESATEWSRLMGCSDDINSVIILYTIEPFVAVAQVVEVTPALFIQPLWRISKWPPILIVLLRSFLTPVLTSISDHHLPRIVVLQILLLPIISILLEYFLVRYLVIQKLSINEFFLLLYFLILIKLMLQLYFFLLGLSKTFQVFFLLLDMLLHQDSINEVVIVVLLLLCCPIYSNAVLVLLNSFDSYLTIDLVFFLFWPKRRLPISLDFRK